MAGLTLKLTANPLIRGSGCNWPSLILDQLSFWIRRRITEENRCHTANSARLLPENSLEKLLREEEIYKTANPIDLTGQKLFFSKPDGLGFKGLPLYPFPSLSVSLFFHFPLRLSLAFYSPLSISLSVSLYFHLSPHFPLCLSVSLVTY